MRYQIKQGPRACFTSSMRWKLGVVVEEKGVVLAFVLRSL